ncbi:MAG TPA: acyltransferase [Geothrix sp.]|nr:acyltransferase [Geothrix sp.]
MTPTTERPKERLEALTSMRFLAAALVVVFHIFHQAPVMQRLPRLLRSGIESGYVWVGFFFILSGFILAYQYGSRVVTAGFDLRDFWLARFARIYPGFLLGFLMVAGLLSVKVWDGGYPPGGGAGMTADLLATLGLVHAWVPSFAITFNFPSWSVSVEAFFYLLFPLLALASARLSLRRFLGLAGLLYLASVAGHLAYCAVTPFGWLGNDWVHDSGRHFIKFFPLVHLPEFILGMAMGRLYGARRHLGLTETVGRRLARIAGILVLAGLCVSDRIPLALMHNVALALPFAALILGLALAPATSFGAWLSHPIPVALGDASYSLYILQVPVIWLFVQKVEWTNATSLPFAFCYRAAILAAITLLALVSHRFLETPARIWLRAAGRRWWRKDRGTPERPGSEGIQVA